MGGSHCRDKFLIPEAVRRMALVSADGLFEPLHDRLHLLFHAALAFRHHSERHAKKCFRNTARDAGQGVAVSPEGYSSPDHVFKIFSLKKSCNRLRHRFLTAFDVVVSRPYLIAGTTEIIAEFTGDIVADLVLSCIFSGHEDRTGHRFRTFDSLRMVMRDFRGPPCHLSGGLKAAVEPPYCRHAHRGSVSVAAVRAHVLVVQPPVEPSAVACVRILVPPAAHGIDKQLLDCFFVRFDALFPGVQQRLRHRERHNAVVGVAGSLAEQREILCLVTPVELIRCADHVA